MEAPLPPRHFYVANFGADGRWYVFEEDEHALYLREQGRRVIRVDMGLNMAFDLTDAPKDGPRIDEFGKRHNAWWWEVRFPGGDMDSGMGLTKLGAKFALRRALRKNGYPPSRRSWQRMLAEIEGQTWAR